MTIIDIFLEQGSTFSQDFDSTDSFTGYSISSKMIDSQGITHSLGATWLDDDMGQFRLEMSASFSSNVAHGLGAYDVEATLGSDVVKIVKGRVYVDKEITK